MRLSVGLVVIVGWTMAVKVAMVARLIALRVVLIHWLTSRLVDPTVMVGHSRVGSVEFLEAARVFISGQNTVLTSS